MKKLNNSDFVRLEDIIKSLKFDYTDEKSKITEDLQRCWIETVGEKISKISRAEKISENNTVTIACRDSYTSNELYLSGARIIEIFKQKAKEAGIEVKTVKFEYKNWKDNRND